MGGDGWMSGQKTKHDRCSECLQALWKFFCENVCVYVHVCVFLYLVVAVLAG